MTGDDVRKLLKADPFRPFVIHYRTGRRWTVNKPEDAWVPPKPGASNVYVADERGLFDILDSSWILDITPKSGGARRRKAG